MGAATGLSENTQKVIPPVYKFTGKERDSESGLDNFGARFDASSLGRFMTPDPLLNSGHPARPQSWNRYAYAFNNPLRITDPTGLYNVDCGGDKTCQKYADRLRKGIEKLTEKVGKMKDGDAKVRLQNALKAMGTENDQNNVTVKFGSLAGTAAAVTDPNKDLSAFTVTFDMEKSSNSDTTGMTMNAAHEGTHVGDFEDPRMQKAGGPSFRAVCERVGRSKQFEAGGLTFSPQRRLS